MDVVDVRAAVALVEGKAISEASDAAVDAAKDWLEENITNPDSPPLDRSLSSSSAAAPADLVGAQSEEIENVKGDLSQKTRNILPNAHKVSDLRGTTADYNNGILKITGLSTAVGGRGIRLCEEFTLSAGTYYFSVSGMSSSVTGIYIEKTSNDDIVRNGAGSFTLASSTELYIGVNVENATTYNETIKLQLEVGSSATAFIQPLTANDEVLKEIVGKAIISKGVLGTDANLDNLDNNTLWNINASNLTATTNHVPFDGFMGQILTVCGDQSRTTIISQIAIAATGSAYMYYRSKYTSWTSWVKVPVESELDSKYSNMFYLMAGSLDNTANADNLSPGTVWNINSSNLTATTNHVPYDGFMGQIMTLSGAKNRTSIISQIATDASTNTALYYRTKYTSWSDWIEVPSSTKLFTLEGIMAATVNLDDLTAGTVWNINSGAVTVTTNHVPYDGFNGQIITLSGSKTWPYIKSQIAVSGTTTPKIYYRTYYTSWGNWEQIALMSDVNAKPIPLNVLYSFTNISCCGDSLTYSQVYTGAETSRQAYRTYPQAIGVISGATMNAFATPGDSPKTWWNTYNQNIISRDNQLAIVYLGTNGGLTDTLATDAPEGTDYTTWTADTLTCYYAKIVAKWKSVGANVCLVKCHSTSGDLTTTNSVITQIADRFGCGLAENQFLSDTVYHYWPNLEGSNLLHYNDLGYSAFAEQLMKNIAEMDKDYLKYIIPQ